MSMTKVCVNLTDAELAAIRALAAAQNITFASALRHAVSIGGYVAREVQAGATLLVERDGRTREVVFQVSR